MYRCIKSFKESDRENGLLLLDMPTGFGKTYSVINYIVDFMTDESNSDKKVFFITTQKKNLPYDELEQRLDKLGLSQLFKERVINLKPNPETALNNYNSSMLKDIPDEIKYSDEFKNFKADVEFLQNAAKGQNADFIKSVSDNFSRNTERIFRNYLKMILYKKFKTVNDRLLAIKTDSAWQWVGKLYPSVFTREKQVLFMSMDKFICPHSTIVEKHYTICNSSIIKGALIFIDEFDATKGTVLKHIIEEGLQEKIDYIEMFNHIYAVLQNKIFPEQFFIPSEIRKSGEYSKQSLKDVMNELKEKADKIFDTYSLRFNHKTDYAEQETSTFLFNDHRYISVLNGQNRFISTYADKKDKINKIIFSADKPADKNNIQILLSKLRRFVSCFQNTVRIFALNYYQVRCENLKDGEEEYSFESAIKSVLTEFNLGSIYENYMFKPILMMSSKSKNNNDDSKYDLSFYESGFRYFAFENSPNYEFKTIISMISFSQTPERILTRLCEKAKVVGVSATASLPSVLCNYDLNYISSKIGGAYTTISDDDRIRLKTEFDKAQCGYKDIHIHAELFDSSNYSVSLWNRIFEDKELCEAAYTLVDRALSNEQSSNTFHQERYFKIALAFKKFISHTDIRSFLCVLNKHPKTGDKHLDIDVLYKIFAWIAQTEVTDVKQMVFWLDGNGYDEKKEELTSRLARGEKLFVISAYQTSGAGQNLQYDIPADLVGTLIKANNRPISAQKDFDAIYLENPTNLTVNMNSDSAVEDKDFVKYIFETEYLQENGEISQDTARQNIKEAFRKYFYGKKSFDASYKTQSVCYYATKQIVQAIGRMCRTNMKQPNIYVFADAKICDSFQVGIADKRLLNPEVLALIDEIKKYSTTEIANPDLISKGELCSDRVNRFITGMLCDEWDEHKMKQWEDLRCLVLAKPTATEADVRSDFRISQFYIQMGEISNKYYYSQDEDYNKTKISFIRKSGFPCEVSATAAKLDRILLFGGMREFFSSSGWATAFAPNKYNMSAALFNNIYKGALGEAAGWFWFKSVLNITLEAIKEPALFELFDYKVPSLPVYVDFKNWHETTRFDEEETIKKVIGKANQCKAKCVIVANVLAENAYPSTDMRMDGITLVCCPSLMTDNILSVDVNKDAATKIRRCLDGICNSHE